MLQEHGGRPAPPPHPHQHTKAKKSLAEKISRTLDKLAAQVTVSPPQQPAARAGAGAGGVARAVYGPVYSYSPAPGYRTVRGPHGVSYQLAGQFYPAYQGWDPGPALYHADYHAHYPAPAPSPGQGWCRCAASGAESVRVRGGVARCRRCSKPKSQPPVRGAAKARPRLQLPGEGGQPSPGPRPRDPQPPAQQAGPRDPYDYIRRTRLKADEWDTYWDTAEAAPAPAQPELSPAPSRAARPEAEEKRGGGRRRQQGAELGVRACDLMEDEDSSQPESKPISNTEAGVSSADTDSVTECVTSPAPAPASEDSEVSEDIVVSEDSEAGAGDRGEAGAQEAASAALLADMASMQSNISVAEMRYRKFQRRNPLRKLSLQIDEVIMEEDEEALENEDRDYQSLHYSSLPPLLENEEEKSSTSSDDEFGLGRFKQVLGDSNFADEILSEIYGATTAATASSRQRSEGGGHTEEGAERAGLGAGQGAGNRSLADEILDELYGSTGRGPGAASPEYSAIAEAGAGLGAAGPHDTRGHGEGAGVGGERTAGESRRYLQGSAILTSILRHNIQRP